MRYVMLHMSCRSVLDLELSLRWRKQAASCYFRSQDHCRPDQRPRFGRPVTKRQKGSLGRWHRDTFVRRRGRRGCGEEETSMASGPGRACGPSKLRSGPPSHRRRTRRQLAPEACSGVQGRGPQVTGTAHWRGASRPECLDPAVCIL
jgi:hypothetical protein